MTDWLLGPHRTRDISIMIGNERARIVVRWIGLRGHHLAVSRDKFKEGTVTRVWFGGLLIKVVRKANENR